MFRGLNESIKQAVKRANIPAFEVRDDAPNTFESMINSFKVNRKLIVWSGGSNNTIFKDPTINYMFRAWHDFVHIRINADFSLQGETRTALRQMSQVGTNLAKVIECEVIKQAEYFFSNGIFVPNQVEFTINNLKGVIK